MSIYHIDANGSDMGEYRAVSFEEAFDKYSNDAGYASLTDMLASLEIEADAGVIASEIDTEALTDAVSEKLGMVSQDSYGDGVAILADGTRFETYDDMAQAIDKRIWDFSIRSRTEADI